MLVEEYLLIVVGGRNERCCLMAFQPQQHNAGLSTASSFLRKEFMKLFK